jgi:hypothetical protein
MAKEIQHNLEKDYAVQGIVKSEADMEVILSSNTNEIMKLTKDYFFNYLGWCKRSKQRRKPKRYISTYVQKNLNTKVIVLNLPKRRDLVDQSCVNEEINSYNRKLGKHLKVFDHVHYI